jgi:Holliday junction DNA helicase RuvA
MELAGRLDEWAAGAEDGRTVDRETVLNQRNLIRDAETALVTLGYKPQQAAKAIALVKEEDLDVEGLIRKALQNLA